MFMNQERYLKHLVVEVLSPSISSKMVLADTWEVRISSTVSQNKDLKHFSTIQQQMQVVGQEASVELPLSSPHMAWVFSGFHCLKIYGVMCLLGFSICWATTVAGPHGTKEYLILMSPTISFPGPIGMCPPVSACLLASLVQMYPLKASGCIQPTL